MLNPFSKTFLNSSDLLRQRIASKTFAKSLLSVAAKDAVEDPLGNTNLSKLPVYRTAISTWRRFVLSVINY